MAPGRAVAPHHYDKSTGFTGTRCGLSTSRHNLSPWLLAEPWLLTTTTNPLVSLERGAGCRRVVTHQQTDASPRFFIIIVWLYVYVICGSGTTRYYDSLHTCRM